MDFLSGIESLVGKSLLRVQEVAPDESRVTMLEMIREFAIEKLETNGEAKTMRASHADLFLQFAEQTEPRLTGQNGRRARGPA